MDEENNILYAVHAYWVLIRVTLDLPALGSLVYCSRHSGGG